MRTRGRSLMAVVLVPVTIAAGLALDRADPRPRADLPSQETSSGAWYCPHGGGTGWKTTLYIANPGQTAVQVRVTGLGQTRPDAPKSYDVDPGTELQIPAASDAAAASSFVEYFGGWVAAGWVTVAGGRQTGAAAEPCAPEAGTRWLAPDGSTQQGEETDVIVMNPFDVDAVIDVAVLSERPAPIRDSAFANLRVPPHRSLVLHLNQVSLDQQAAGAEVVARTGRVAVASLGISRDGGIRGVIGVTAPADRVLLAGMGDLGQSTVVAMAVAETETRFGATLLSEGEPAGVEGLTDVTQAGQSAHAYQLLTRGPSLLDVQVEQGAAPIAVVRRTRGEGGDAGATGGTPVPAAAWLITPTVAGEPSHPGIVLGNPGASPVDVTLRLLGGAGDESQIVVSVPPASAVAVPATFLERDPTAAVLAVAVDGSFVATGASSSMGANGIASYAVAAGIAVPTGVLHEQ